MNRTTGNLYFADQNNQRVVELTAWGEFIRVWGWGVVDGSSAFQICTEVVSCQDGSEGSGSGQLSFPQGVAVDSLGNVYVVDLGNHRVQKFDSEGHFVAMFGGNVNKTKSEELGSTEAQRNLCTAASTDVCQAGTTGAGNGQFGAWTAGNYISVGTSDKVYVGDQGRIQVFDSGGHYLEDFPDPEGAIAAGTVEALAPAPSSGLYVALSGKANVRRLTSTGTTQCTVEAAAPTAVASDNAGNPYVVEASGTVRKFSAACADKAEPFGTGEITSSTGIATSQACLTAGADVYVSNLTPSFVRAYGAPPNKPACPKPEKPPFISAQYATSVSSFSATLKAQINPRFWADASYWVQYGTAECLQESGGDWEAECVKELPAPPGPELGAGIADDPITTAGVVISGLEPNTEYLFRFAAQSEGGGPVFGVGGEEGLDGEVGEFATFAAPFPPGIDSCPNASLRLGSSASLPDCRAYEMVSPIDKAGGDIFPLFTSIGRRARLDQSALSGDKLAYTTFQSFGDTQSQPYSPEYIATREEGVGWSSHAISPPRGVQLVGGIAENDTEYKVFSADLCMGWLVRDRTTAPPLAPGAVEGAFNLYQGSNCGAGSYLTLGAGGLKFENEPAELQGISSDEGHTIFRSQEHLTQDAATVTGAPLTCKTPSAATTIAFQWLREGAPIAGKTNAEYTTQAADAGKTIQCQVRASNANAGTTQIANPAWVIAPYPASEPPLAPETIPAPNASAPLEVGGPGGQTLSCDPNAAGWGGSPSFEYQWYRNGQPIAAATGQTYGVSAADLSAAAAFQCEAIGKNAGGTVAKVSDNALSSPAPSGPVAPKLSVRTTVTGFDGYLYESDGEGNLQQVCVLPEGVPGEKTASRQCSAGSASGEYTDTRSQSISGAISEDGSRVFWSDAVNETGKIYARIDGEKTIPVSGAVSSAAAQFLGANEQGTKVLFSIGSLGGGSADLYEFDVDKAIAGEPNPATLIAHKAFGVVGTSEDLSRIYLVSKEALDGGATEGARNLYLYESGTFSFVGRLSGADVNLFGKLPSAASLEPYNHVGRISPDGGVAVFMSTSSPTGYDNTDAISGEADAEVYRYDAETDELDCVSCMASGARPSGARNLSKQVAPYWAAAQIPGSENQLYASRALSDDGSRLFFESFEPLVLRDTNGRQDVYEWEEAGTGSCGEESPSFSPPAGGCISLISSGQGTQDSEFVDATPSGNDVFIRIPDSLVNQDPGQFDIYDARVGGGLPQPEAPKPPCEGEACQNAAAPPQAQTPASAAFSGPGNVKPVPSHRCPRSKRKVTHHKGKARCVARKASKHKRAKHRRAQRHNGRAHR